MHWTYSPEGNHDGHKTGLGVEHVGETMNRDSQKQLKGGTKKCGTTWEEIMKTPHNSVL